MGVSVGCFAFLKELAARLAIKVHLKLEETTELKSHGECTSYQLDTLREFMEETVQRLQPLVRSDLTRCEGGINRDGALEVGHVKVCSYQPEENEEPVVHKVHGNGKSGVMEEQSCPRGMA